MRKRLVLTVNPPINDGATVETWGELHLCRRVLTENIRISAFQISPKPDFSKIEYEGWHRVVYTPPYDIRDNVKLTDVITVVHETPTLFERWFGVEVPVMEDRSREARKYTFELILRARAESKAGVGLIAWTPLNEQYRMVFNAAIFFQNESDAVHFSMLTHGERDVVPPPIA